MITTLHTILERILPRWIHQRLIGDWDQTGFKKYFTNTGWMFAARIVSLVVSFFTIAIIARYLGPENYGKLSYAQSFVAIISVFASLGIDQILYRNLAAEPEREAEILGTAFITKLFFGSLTLVSSIGLAIYIQSDPILTWLIALIALTFIFQPFSVLSAYFNAKVQAKYPAIITMILAFLIPALKLLIVYFDEGILYFAAVITFESLFTVICYTIIYIHLSKKNPLQWSFSRLTFFNLVNDSWPLMLASLSGYIYGRIDQVMIQNLLDSTSVGLYDVAVRLTELLGFLPGAIVASLLPAVMNARTRSSEEYNTRLRSLTLLCISISLLSALFLFILTPWVVALLFGSDFTASVAVLRIYVWSSIGTVSVMLIQQYLIIEHRSKQFLFYSIFGAGLNVLLNLYLIPVFGILGAAYATLLTLSLVVTFFLFQSRILSEQK